MKPRIPSMTQSANALAGYTIVSAGSPSASRRYMSLMCLRSGSRIWQLCITSSGIPLSEFRTALTYRRPRTDLPFLRAARAASSYPGGLPEAASCPVAHPIGQSSPRTTTATFRQIAMRIIGLPCNRYAHNLKASPVEGSSRRYSPKARQHGRLSQFLRDRCGRSFPTRHTACLVQGFVIRRGDPGLRA